LRIGFGNGVTGVVPGAVMYSSLVEGEQGRSSRTERLVRLRLYQGSLWIYVF
jgi:hypothetical protein